MTIFRLQADIWNGKKCKSTFSSDNFIFENLSVGIPLKTCNSASYKPKFENLSVENHNFLHLYFSKIEIYPSMNLKTDDIQHREISNSEIYRSADLKTGDFQHRETTNSEIYLLMPLNISMTNTSRKYTEKSKVRQRAEEAEKEAVRLKLKLQELQVQKTFKNATGILAARRQRSDVPFITPERCCSFQTYYKVIVISGAERIPTVLAPTSSWYSANP